MCRAAVAILPSNVEIVYRFMTGTSHTKDAKVETNPWWSRTTTILLWPPSNCTAPSCNMRNAACPLSPTARPNNVPVRSTKRGVFSEFAATHRVRELTKTMAVTNGHRRSLPRCSPQQSARLPKGFPLPLNELLSHFQTAQWGIQADGNFSIYREHREHSMNQIRSTSSSIPTRSNISATRYTP